MSELNYSIYMNQITVKIYEFNVQNTKHLPIQQNDDLNKNTKSFYTIINNLNSDLVFSKLNLYTN